jgi:MarR family transcriptional regulator, transcriptional regulator for hemolysin
MQNNHMPPAKGIGLLVHDVSRLLRRRVDHQAQTVGLTSAQWRVLAAVSRAEMLGEEPVHQATLADMMDMEPITLSRQVDRMEAAGMIERRPDPGDRRVKRLYLTEAARPLVDKFRSVAKSCYDNVLTGISDQEVEQVVGILTRIRANLVHTNAQPAEDNSRQAAQTDQTRNTEGVTL